MCNRSKACVLEGEWLQSLHAYFLSLLLSVVGFRGEAPSNTARRHLNGVCALPHNIFRPLILFSRKSARDVRAVRGFVLV
jgi:hypothetical protein